MTRKNRMRHWWHDFWRGYRRLLIRPELVRVDPLTILTIVGVVGALWNIGLATGTAGNADETVQRLLNAPDEMRAQLDRQLASDTIDPYTYNARMVQIDQLDTLFRQYAHLYQSRGNEIFDTRMIDSMRDTALSLAPGEAAGKLAGGVNALQTGKGIDALITLQGLRNGLEGDYTDLYTSWKTSPFADIDQQLEAQINAILGSDLEPFFAARMTGKVNELKNIYLDLSRQYPNDSAAVEQEYRRILRERAERYADVMMLTGEGRHWPSVDAFQGWLDGMVQDAIAAEGPDADLFPDEPETAESTGYVNALPAISVAGGSAAGDERVELFRRSINFDDDVVLAEVCAQALPILQGYQLDKASASWYHPKGPTLLCDYTRPTDQGELHIAITHMRTVADATQSWNQYWADQAPSSDCLSDPVVRRQPDLLILHCFMEEGFTTPQRYETEIRLRYRNTELHITEQLLRAEDASRIDALANWGLRIVDERLALP